MNTLLLISSAGAFLIAILGLWSPAESFVKKTYAWIPLPALILGFISVSHPELGINDFRDLLLGTRIGLDELGRAFLILIAVVWLLAGIYSRTYFANDSQERLFRFYFLATYSGTMGLIMVQDAPAFYTGYALMTVGGYGLIIHEKTESALVAGRVYIAVALIGEMLALAGIIVAASTATSFSLADIATSIRTSPKGIWCFWLIFIGFGTKVGLVPLHFWLPRSYYWAPLPAVAVLSGAMTKVGVLGWFRFLSLAESAFASTIVIGAGALMVFYGVAFGLMQTRAKTTLAFSSLSQMGYLTIAFATIIEPGASSNKAIAAAIGYAFHHGITKMALFLGLGVLARFYETPKTRRLVIASLIVCSLSLIGFPLTSGAYAKAILKDAGSATGVWHSASTLLLLLGSIGTTLLMMRFIVLCLRGEHDQVQPARSWVPWGLSFAMVFFSWWLLPALFSLLDLEVPSKFSIIHSLNTYLPVAIGSLIAAAFTYKLWLSHSHLTPRPFDTVMQEMYKSVWEDFPRDIDRFIEAMTQTIDRLRHHLKLRRKAQKAVTFARQIHTGWVLGCTLFIAIGVLLWAFLSRDHI